MQEDESAISMFWGRTCLLLLATPLLMCFVSIIFMASIGKSIGVRRFYINILLKIFEVSGPVFLSSKHVILIHPK